MRAKSPAAAADTARGPCCDLATPSALVIAFSFELLLEFGKRRQPWPFKLVDPALGNLVDRHRIDEVKLLAALPLRRNQIRLLENGEMLGDSLPRHGETVAQFEERLPVPPVQTVEQLPSASIGQSTKHRIFIHGSYATTRLPVYMQPTGCLSSCMTRRAMH
jgi:hypothetical protein